VGQAVSLRTGFHPDRPRAGDCVVDWRTDMFDKYMVMTRGFQNVTHTGEVTGFQMRVRITYYRGIFLPLLSGFDVTVNGEKFRPEHMRFTLGNHTYTFEELGKAEKVHWDFGVPATLTILKPGGLKPGIYEVEVMQTVKPSYMPPTGFTGTFKRKITLVA
jgi:hypothetical protein